MDQFVWGKVRYGQVNLWQLWSLGNEMDAHWQPDIKSTNDFTKELVKTVVKPTVNASGNKFTYSFPPHLFTLLVGKLQK